MNFRGIKQELFFPILKEWQRVAAFFMNVCTFRTHAARKEKFNILMLMILTSVLGYE